ncbi:hypothetical protein [Haloarcula sebkhae]|uniref:Uncharacterized protein n=2 Tax=Haloarcula sebkhae TaxID=932660 RepID=A0ACC6VL33_9EURY|nr:hypothetical protein [Haloarcula sebkhae]GGK84517.1 hypothetical protein GCM10009067_40850 [Haloarcula sebkhae]
MAATEAQTVELHDGTELAVQYLGATGDDTAEFEVEPKAEDDTRRWRLEIERIGGYEVVAAWDGVAVDFDAPDWVHELVDQAV